jgi:predicted lipid carrier protein YhbT
MIEVSVPEKVWRFFISGGGGLDQFSGGGQAAPSPAELLRRYEKLQSTNGKLNMEIKQDDGSTIPVSMTFNGVPEPSATLKVGMQDFIAMQQKKVDGQALFMSGKLSVDGDLLFLMSLQSLM